MLRPQKSEYPASIYTSRYIESVEHENVMEALSAQMQIVINLFKNFSEEQAGYRYAPEKWSLKQLLGHITDTERIFAYRALAIARGEQQSLLGFDENEYMEASNFEVQSLSTLIEQYQYNRLSSMALFNTFSEEVLDRKGTANGNSLTVRAILWMVAGHEAHHLNIIRERYLSGLNIS